MGENISMELILPLVQPFAYVLPFFFFFFMGDPFHGLIPHLVISSLIRKAQRKTSSIAKVIDGALIFHGDKGLLLLKSRTNF